MFRRPVFVKSLLMMFIVVIIVLFVFIPIYIKIMQSERSKVIDEHRYYFSRSVDLLDSKFKDAQQFISLLNSSYTYQRLKSLRNKSELQYYAKLNEATTVVQNAFRLTESNIPAFIYMSNNDSVIASSLLSDTSHEFFSKKMIFNNLSPSDVLSTISLKDSSMVFLPEHSIQLMGINDLYLPFVYQDIGDSSILCILFDSDLISEWFNLELYENTEFFFYITETADKYENRPVFKREHSSVTENMPAMEGYTIFRTKFANVNYQCVLGIPNTFYSPYVKPSMILLVVTIIAAVAIAGFISYLMASRSYRPLHELIALSYTASKHLDLRKQNEYSFIRHYIEQICQSNKQLSSYLEVLRSEKRSNTLIRLAFDFPQQESELRSDLSLLPQLADDFRIAIIGYNNDSETVILALKENLNQQMVHSFCMARLRKNQIILLLPDHQDILHILEQVVAQTSREIDQQLHAGISKTCSSISDLQSGLYQAQSVLTKEITLSTFESNHHEQGSHHLSLRDQNFFINVIFSGNQDKAVEIIRTIASSASETASDNLAIQSYYLLRSAIEHVSAAFKCQDSGLINDTDGKTLMDLFANLENSAESLCKKSHELMNTGNQALKQDIVHFVDQYFTSTEITSSLIAEHFQISDKYVFRLFKEQTGSTLNKYIETLRMELAMNKIISSNQSINRIAFLCGYSTSGNFYKAFRKYYGQPPGFFRKSQTIDEINHDMINSSQNS